MPEILEQIRNRRGAHLENANSYISTIYNGVYYPEQREDDVGETSHHIKLIADFVTILKYFFKNRGNVFLSVNMNLYYEKGSPQKWFAPDLFVAFGVPNVERSSYLLWREQVFPQVIFEVSSGKTWSNDLDAKFRFYEKFGAEEYYIFDPEFAYLPSPLMAFHRKGEKLVELEIENERIFSPLLNLEIVRTANTFRLFNPQTNDYLRTLDEAETELARLKAEIEKLKSQK